MVDKCEKEELKKNKIWETITCYSDPKCISQDVVFPDIYDIIFLFQVVFLVLNCDVLVIFKPRFAMNMP
jgi:hypothetical protein